MSDLRQIRRRRPEPGWNRSAGQPRGGYRHGAMAAEGDDAAPGGVIDPVHELQFSTPNGVRHLESAFAIQGGIFQGFGPSGPRILADAAGARSRLRTFQVRGGGS